MRMKTYAVAIAIALLVTLQVPAIADAPEQPVKWSQLPDMVGGLDWSSEVKVPSTVADDFLCQDGLPVTDIHWWGSYWLPNNPVPPDGSTHSDALPNAPPGGIEKFIIRFWTDIPKDPNIPLSFSRPGQELWAVDAYQFFETFYGVTTNGEEVYQYNVYLDPADWFLQEQGLIYWISIEAVLQDPTRQWGWHESKDHWNDAAVQDFKSSGWVAIQNNLYDSDMAFELTTIPEPGSLVALLGGMVALFGVRRRRG